MIRFSVEPLGEAAGLMIEWRALHARAGDAPFFLSPAWMAAWLAGKPSHIDLSVVRGVLGEETMLLGVFGRNRRRHPPLVGASAAHFHEFGAADFDSVYVEYNDFLVAANAPAGARQGAVRAVLEAFAREDDIVFRNVRTPLARAVDAADAARWNVRTINPQPTFAVDLRKAQTEGAAFLASLGGSLGAQVRRSIRRYEERGALTFEIAATDPERAAAWKTLIELHEESWRRRGRRGVFSNAAFVAFHQRLMRNSPENVHLATLKCAGEPIGCLYNFVEGGRVLNYQSGFRFEDDNQLKPGFVAHALAVRYYAGKGFSVYDLLAGEAPYKRRLAAEKEVLSTIVLEKRTGLRSGARRAARAMRKVFVK